MQHQKKKKQEIKKKEDEERRIYRTGVYRLIEEAEHTIIRYPYFSWRESVLVSLRVLRIILVIVLMERKQGSGVGRGNCDLKPPTLPWLLPFFFTLELN